MYLVIAIGLAVLGAIAGVLQLRVVFGHRVDDTCHQILRTLYSPHQARNCDELCRLTGHNSTTVARALSLLYQRGQVHTTSGRIGSFKTVDASSQFYITPKGRQALLRQARVTVGP